MSEMALCLSHVDKSVKVEGRSTGILHDISLKIDKGTITAITGKSGSGKTTLLAVASGMDAPDKGRVEILGKDFYKIKEAEQDAFRNKRIGLLFQNYHLIPELTCEENIRMPMCFSDTKMSEAKLSEWMTGVGLKNKRNLYPRQMSGGEQQRTAILRAIINHPDIIFADEPTGALDSKTSDRIIRFLISYTHKSGKTIILVTHDKEIAGQCDRVIEIEDGRIMSE